MANGFVVAKFHSHILHTSTKIKSISLTSQRKYKTNSSSPASLKILNKILGKTLQNTLGVEVILKYIQDCPCFTTKPFFTECIGRRHQKLGPNTPHSKFHLHDTAGDQFKNNLGVEKSENKSTYTDIGSKMQTIKYNNVKTKFQKAYFAKCFVHRDQKPDSYTSDPMYSYPLKGSATDQIEATGFSDKDNLAIEKSESKPTYIESKVQTKQYKKVRQAKFQKPYFTKCPGHYHHKPGSNAPDSRFPLYSIPSKNPATDITKAIYISNKGHLENKTPKNKPAYFHIGSKVQTTEYSKNEAKYQNVFTKYVGHHHQKLGSNASDPMYPNPLKDSVTNQIEATYFLEKDNLAMEKYANKPADIDIGSKVRRIEYNKVKAKFQSPYSTKRTGRYHQNLGSNASQPMFSLYPIPSLTPIPDQNKAIGLSDQDSLTMESTESRSVNIDIGSKVQRVEYNKVKAKYVENSPEPDYGLKLVERMHVIPKIPQPEEKGDMIEFKSELKYNKVKPRYQKYVNLNTDPKHTQSTQL